MYLMAYLAHAPSFLQIENSVTFCLRNLTFGSSSVVTCSYFSSNGIHRMLNILMNTTKFVNIWLSPLFFCFSGYRKRILSQSDDDSLDLFRTKKSNGLETSKSRKDSHKRPAEVTMELDSKKLRISGEDLGKEKDNEKEGGQRQEENDRWRTPTAESLGDSAFESDKESGKIGDPTPLLMETTPTDLPFLRKLHKTEFSKMSRSVSLNLFY